MALKAVFDSLENRYNLQFYYQEEWLEPYKISLNITNGSVEEVLRKTLENTSYGFEIIRRKYVVLMPLEHIALYKGTMENHSTSNTDEDILTIGNSALTGHNKKATISGKIVNGKTGEPLFGATIGVKSIAEAVISNYEGQYSLTLNPGIYTVQVSSVSFKSELFNIKLLSSGTFNVELFKETVNLGEVSVYASSMDRNLQNTHMGMVEISSKTIKKLPSLNGEKDIVKSFTLMPGVQTVGEFGSGINVRGGSEDQNLYLLNEAPIFNTTHMFGLVSVINPDVVNKATLFKGHIPASYGERVSSILDIRTKYNGSDEFLIVGGIGLYTSRLMTKTPVFKNKGSFVVGGRLGYPNWIIHRVSDYDLQNSSTYFYDVSASFSYKFKNNSLLFSAYNSTDEFNYANEFKYDYANVLLSAVWQQNINSQLFGRLVLAYSNYSRSKAEKGYGQNGSVIESALGYSSGKYSLNYQGIAGHNLEAGVQVIHYKIKPAHLSPYNIESVVQDYSLSSEQAFESSIFLKDKFTLSEKIVLDVGLRYTNYAYLNKDSVNIYNVEQPLSEESIIGNEKYNKGELIKSYNSFEPRLSVLYKTSKNSSLKFNYNFSKQYISLLSYSSITTPDDIWKLCDTYIKPAESQQFALGYYQNFMNNMYEASVEIYYKQLKNLHEYKDDALPEMNNHIETELLNANGKNYGVELLIKKTGGTLNGWLSYSYSRALNVTNGKYDEEKINANNWYSSAFDRPHNISLITSYNLNKRIRFTSTFNYATGRPVTLPEYQYSTGGQTVVLYSTRNKYRLPNYHRLDLAISIDENFKKNKRWKGSWTFSILNIYGRKNANSLFYEKQAPGYYNDNKIYSMYKLYIIGSPLPTITYNFKF